LPERLDLELKKLCNELANVNVSVVAPSHRKYSVWLGGSKMASVPSFSERWVSKNEYLEHGAAVIHRKCGSS
jgi:actin-related protein